MNDITVDWELPGLSCELEELMFPLSRDMYDINSATHATWFQQTFLQYNEQSQARSIVKPWRSAYKQKLQNLYQSFFPDIFAVLVSFKHQVAA